ncbi:MAG: hypothetical protein WED04_01695 [Promethearchaeati archaeon SRVP18_Atabeyarchaeia-1]
MPIDVESLVDIFGKIKTAMAGQEDRMTEDIEKIQYNQFEFPETSQASSFTAIDGSFIFLWRLGATSVVAVRVAAITYGNDFKIINQVCDDRVALLSFDESVTDYIDDRTMRQILHITSSSSSLIDIETGEETTKGITAPDNDERHGKNAELKPDSSSETASRSYVNKDRTDFAAELYMVAKEFEMADKVSSVHSNTIIAIDGGLARRSEAPFKEHIDATARNCFSNSSAFVGIVKGTSKSSFNSMYRDEIYAEKIARKKNLEGCWYIEVPGDVKLRYAKLHPLAVQPFRIDINEKTVNPKAWCHSTESIIKSIAYYTSNELCLGYPFPSAEAHQLAVTLRHMFPALQSICLQAAIRSGFTYQEALSYLASIYGTTRSDFHTQLDGISRKGKGSQLVRGSVKT